jgi:uncharacterized protein
MCSKKDESKKIKSMPDKIRINGQWIGKGETAQINTFIAKLPSHTPINTPIFVYRGKEDGPVLLLMAGMHGDEINGMEIVRRMIDENLVIPDRGSVICVPILNIYGFINTSRAVPDGKDVNRSFPGNQNGSLASRVAYYIMKDILPNIDYGVDFHTGGAARTNYPQIRCVFSDPVNLELAHAFHAPFTINSPYRPKSLRYVAGKMGKRILVYEGGESSRFDDLAIEEGIRGTLRLMYHLGMSDVKPEPITTNLLIHKSTWVRAKNSGLFRTGFSYGALIRKNQVIGTITDPFGEFQVKIKSPATGYIVGLNNNPVVSQGDALMHIGLVENPQ